MRWTCGLLALGLIACGDDGGTGMTDAPSTMPITVTISGVATSIGLGGRTPQSGVKIDVFARSDDSMIATTMTDANGAFTITQMSNGPVDAYLKATKATFKDSYLYPPGPVAENFSDVPVLLLTPGTWDQVNGLLLGETQDAGNGWVGLIVQDKLQAPTTPVMGATVTTSPAGAPVHYNGTGTNPLPNRNAMSTAMDGIAYAVNVPAGNLMVSAQKAGLTFRSHSITTRADQITLTLIIQ